MPLGRFKQTRRAWNENGSHQLLVYADDNILAESIHSIQKNTEDLLVTSKETALEVNADKTKYSTRSCLEIRMQDKVTIWRLIIVPLKGWNSSDMWEQFFFFLNKKKKSFQEEIKSRKKKGNACSSSLQNLLSSTLLLKYIRIQTYRKINLPVV